MQNQPRNGIGSQTIQCETTMEFLKKVLWKQLMNWWSITLRLKVKD